MKKIIIFAALLCVSFAGAQAQTISELFKFSNYDFSAATARTAGMAGAYTSLGADLSSMSVNPAGLAMYSGSEVGFTFGINSANIKSRYGDGVSNKQNSTKFSMPNVAGVYNIGEVTIGFGINNLANFNSSMRASGNYEKYNSKARMWVDQLQGIRTGTLDDENKMFRGQQPSIWDAIMAYDSFLIDADNPDNPNNTMYNLTEIIDPEDYIASQITTETEGAINEFDVSAAYNFDDIIYLGATLGFQYLYYTERSVYEEYNRLDESGHTGSGIFDYLYTQDRLSLEGIGFNMKVGATIRPLSWLRIGVAYHSPTWMHIDEYGVSEMEPYFVKGEGRYSWSPDLIQDYYMQSPSRLLAGTSAALFGRLIISVDYERTWYNSMLYTTDINASKWRDGNLSTDVDNLINYADYTNPQSGNIDMNGMIDNYYRPVNNYRVGLEVQALRGLFVRGGFAYSDSPYVSEKSYYAQGDVLSDFGATTRYTAGIGYRTGKFNIDFAYTNTKYTMLPSKFFDYVTQHSYDAGLGDIFPEGTEIMSLENISQRVNTDNFLLSMSWRLW